MNDTYPAKYRNRVKASVVSRDVELVLGEYVVEFPPSGSGELVFKSGKKLNAGLVVSPSRCLVPQTQRQNKRLSPRDLNRTLPSSNNPSDPKHSPKTNWSRWRRRCSCRLIREFLPLEISLNGTNKNRQQRRMVMPRWWSPTF